MHFTENLSLVYPNRASKTVLLFVKKNYERALFYSFFHVLCLSGPGDGWCDAFGIVPAKNVSGASTLQIFHDASCLAMFALPASLICTVASLGSGMCTTDDHKRLRRRRSIIATFQSGSPISNSARRRSMCRFLRVSRRKSCASSGQRGLFASLCKTIQASLDGTFVTFIKSELQEASKVLKKDDPCFCSFW